MVPPTLLIRTSTRLNSCFAALPATTAWAPAEGFEVGLEGDSLCPGGLDLFDLSLTRSERSDGQHLAPSLQPQRDAPADALGGTGDDDDLFLETVGRCSFVGSCGRDENFSKWKLLGVTPTPDIHLRTPSTIGGGRRQNVDVAVVQFLALRWSVT